MTSRRSAIVTAVAVAVIQNAASQTCTPSPSGLVAWWPGDGNARDIIGPNHGTIAGGITFASGKVAEAFRFSGADSQVELGTNRIIGFGTAAFTVSQWIRPTVAPVGSFFFGIRLKQDTEFFSAITKDYNLGITVPGDYLVLTFRGEPQQWWIPIALPGMLNRWSHLAIGYNGGNKSDPSSYVASLDGVPLPTGSVNVGPVGGTCNENILGSHAGSSCAGGSVSFAGDMDEVQIFNRILTTSEIQAIVSAGSSGMCKPVVTIAIDIRPGAYPNTINLNSNGVLPVAILGSAAFDATTVDPSSVTLASAPVRTRGNGAPMSTIQDTNGDGHVDLLLQIETDALALTSTDVEAVLTGRTFGGQAVRGTDTIRVVP